MSSYSDSVSSWDHYSPSIQTPNLTPDPNASPSSYSSTISETSWRPWSHRAPSISDSNNSYTNLSFGMRTYLIPLPLHLLNGLDHPYFLMAQNIYMKLTKFHFLSEYGELSDSDPSSFLFQLFIETQPPFPNITIPLPQELFEHCRLP